MAYAIGSISGCHINPAVTISMLVAGKTKAKDAVIHIIMQCLGAIIAAGVLLATAKGLPSYVLAQNGLGQNGYGANSPAGYSLGASFLAEAVLTFVFLIRIFNVVRKTIGGS